MSYLHSPGATAQTKRTSSSQHNVDLSCCADSPIAQLLGLVCMTLLAIAALTAFIISFEVTGVIWYTKSLHSIVIYLTNINMSFVQTLMTLTCLRRNQSIKPVYGKLNSAHHKVFMSLFHKHAG